MTQNLHLTRRHFALLSLAALSVRGAQAAPYREIDWDDLIPPGVPYAEIIGDGDKDIVNDTWAPVFDENATKLNTALDGAEIKLPGYMIPLDVGAEGVRAFMLVPYVGACIHVPPPPPNQLIFVTTQTPWPSDDIWDAIWVSGRLQASPKSTELAEVGYQLQAEKIEIYEW